jgi:hypothetical protein
MHSDDDIEHLVFALREVWMRLGLRSAAWFTPGERSCGCSGRGQGDLPAFTIAGTPRKLSYLMTLIAFMRSHSPLTDCVRHSGGFWKMMNQYVSESRALDIPIALVNRHRELTSKGEFVVTVWSAAAVGLGRLHHAQDRARCTGLQKSIYSRFY